MENKVKVIVDSTVDMSLEKLKELDVTMLPLSVLINDEEYKDLIDIRWDELIDKVKKYNTLPKTSAISIQTFIDYFNLYVKDGYDVIYLSLGKEFSCNYSNACVASCDYPNHVFVLDSKNLSSAIALQLLKICKYRDEGLCAKEIAEKMEYIIDCTQTETALETMEYLYKGGRCSGIKYLLGSILRLFPIVKVNGKITVHKIGKGFFKNSLNIIINDFKKDLDEGNVDTDNIIISSVGNEKGQRYLYEKISSFFPKKKILLFDAGCVVSSHCGPGTTGFFYIKKNRIENK